MKATSTFSIKAEVLCIRLCNEQLETLGNEVTDGPGIVFETPGRKALVGCIEEGEERSTLHECGNLLPLISRWVYTRRIVSTRVQEDDATFGSLFESIDHALKVEALGLGGKVRVCVYWDFDIGEDLVVVGPRGRGEIDGLCFWGGRVIEFGEEEGT